MRNNNLSGVNSWTLTVGVLSPHGSYLPDAPAKRATRLHFEVQLMKQRRHSSRAQVSWRLYTRPARTQPTPSVSDTSNYCSLRNLLCPAQIKIMSLFDGFFFLFIPVALLGFVVSGASSHNGRHLQKLRTLKQTQLFISFYFIWLCNLKFVEPRRSNYFWFKNLICHTFCDPGQPHHSHTPSCVFDSFNYNRLVSTRRRSFQVLSKRRSHSASCSW